MSLHNKVKIRFIEFLRPDGFWPHPYTIEQAFQVFQWMVRTGKKYQKYGRPGVVELLSMKPTCSGFQSVYPIISLSDLRKRFHYALLSHHASDLAEKWRSECQVSVMGERWLSFPYRDEWIDQKKLTEFFDTKGTLSVQLNDSHPGAVNIARVSIQVWEDSFRFRLDYGYEGSSWHHTLAETEQGECFIDTFTRAVEHLKTLTNKED